MIGDSAPIACLNLSVRAERRLADAGVRTVGQLRALDLAKVGLGSKMHRKAIGEALAEWDEARRKMFDKEGRWQGPNRIFETGKEETVATYRERLRVWLGIQGVPFEWYEAIAQPALDPVAVSQVRMDAARAALKACAPAERAIIYRELATWWLQDGSERP